MTGAIVSGQAGVAVFVKGSQAWCVSRQTAQPQLISQGLFPHLFGDAEDARHFPEATIDSARELLEEACRKERGLQLALISMDSACSDTTRDLSEDALEDLLDYSYVGEFISNRLFSRPLPNSSLWLNWHSSGLNYSKVAALHKSVMDSQQWILQGRAAWDAIPVQDFGEEGGKPEFESVLIETGAFRTIAVAMASGAKQGSAQLQLLADQRYKRFPNFRHVLMQWARVIPKATQAGVQRVLVEDDRRKSDRPRAKSKKTTGHETFQNVNVQKSAIQRQLQLGNLAQAEKYVDELVKGQVTSGRPDLAAKSLCDLAKDAKDLGYGDYQLTWSAKARELSPGDPFVHNQFADALLGIGDLPKALAVYKSTASDFPQNEVARTGKAEVLKALGRFPDALAAYESTVRDFPQNVVARSGKAEVLKALGRLPEALAAYESTVRDFPQNAVARNGKASVFVRMGRYQEAEALVATEQTQTRVEWIALHILATIKLKLGKHGEAEKLFAKGAGCLWADVKSRFIAAQAVLLMDRKQLSEADALIRSERSLESKVVQIDIYRRMNRISDARKVLLELSDCKVASIIEISRDLERNMGPGPKTISNEKFVEREIEMLMAA